MNDMDMNQGMDMEKCPNCECDGCKWDKTQSKCVGCPEGCQCNAGEAADTGMSADTSDAATQ